MKGLGDNIQRCSIHPVFLPSYGPLVIAPRLHQIGAYLIDEEVSP